MDSLTDNELLQAIYNDMRELKSDVQELKSDVQELKKRTTSIELTLENEIIRSIKIIAEGHLDLNRKLDNALKTESEKEILLLKINHLENEIRKIKEQITA